jgi:hypothetical protein
MSINFPLPNFYMLHLPPLTRGGDASAADNSLQSAPGLPSGGVSGLGGAVAAGNRAYGRTSGATRGGGGTSRSIPEGAAEEEREDERGQGDDDATCRSDDDNQTLAKEERAALRSMKEEMRLAGTLQVYQEGAAERRRLKAGLGFSKQLQLDGQLPDTAADADLDV